MRIAAAAAILLAVAAAAVVWRAPDDGASPPRAGAPGGAPAAAASVYARARFGYSLRVPSGWRVREGRRATRLTSPGDSVAIVVTSPTSGRFVARVWRDARRALLSSYRPARVVGAGRARLGALRARSTEVAGTARDGRRVRVLSTVAASRWRTYAVAVLTAVPPDAARFVEAQRILGSLRFGRPVRAG